MAVFTVHAESLVVACELLVVACGILFSDQGWNPGPLDWEHGVLATGPPGKSSSYRVYLWFSTYFLFPMALRFTFGTFSLPTVLYS